MSRTDKITQAVILAAGMGRRILSIHKNPKGWLQLGDKPIIEESIETLHHFGVDNIVIVTGHDSHLYEALPDRYEGITTVFNPDYASSGALHSWYTARDRVGDEFLLLESDIIYEPRAIDSILHAAEPNTLLLSGPTGLTDEVYVECVDGVLHHMSQNKDEVQEITGELVGICRFSRRIYECMMKTIPPERAAVQNIGYEQGILAASKSCAVHGLLVPDLAWCEIDDEYQFQVATERIYPKIREQRASWKP